MNVLKVLRENFRAIFHIYLQVYDGRLCYYPLAGLFRFEGNTCLFENPRLYFVAPYAQHVERTAAVVLFRNRAWG